MRELNIVEVETVCGAVDQATQIGFQGGLVAMGFGLLAAGFAFTPLGAAVMIGTSLAVTGGHVWHVLR